MACCVAIWQASVLYWPEGLIQDSGCHITDLLDVDIGIYIEHVAHSVTVYTNTNLFETIILMFLCIGEYSVTSYL